MFGIFWRLFGWDDDGGEPLPPVPAPVTDDVVDLFFLADGTEELTFAGNEPVDFAAVSDEPVELE